MKRLPLTVSFILGAFALLHVLPVLADDLMYKCDDGTFTNLPERLCAQYEPQGVVIVLPEGATLNWARAQVSDAELKLMRAASLGSTAAPASAHPSEACVLYKEWIDLNLQTGGGVTFQYTERIPRWLALSRIFTAIGAPQCP